MIRNFKVMGLAAMAVFALSAVGASAAQAAPEFHCETTGTSCIVKGTSEDNVFKIGGAKVTCTSTSIEGTEVKTSTTLPITPTYTGCKAFGVKANVSMEGCTYLLHLTSGGTTPFPTTTDIVCPTGKTIKVAAVGLVCNVTVGAQTGLEGLKVTNEATTPKTVKATIGISGISYTEAGAECPEPGSSTTGKYEGTIIVKGFKDEAGGAQAGIFVA